MKKKTDLNLNSIIIGDNPLRYSIDSFFDRGKYKEKKVELMAHFFPEYLEWMVLNEKEVILSSDIIVYVEVIHEMKYNFTDEFIGKCMVKSLIYCQEHENSFNINEFRFFKMYDKLKLTKGKLTCNQSEEEFIKKYKFKMRDRFRAYLKKTQKTKSMDSYEYGDDPSYGDKFRKYQGGVTGTHSDDFIDDVFDGNPSAYWNID